MKREELAEQREYAWNYFALHADQRMKMYHFFIIFESLACGAVLTLIKDGNYYFMGCVFSLLVPFFSFVFWKLDERTKALIKHSEEALKLLEFEYPYREEDKRDQKNNKPHRLQLFTYEEHITRKSWPYPIHFTYSKCFNITYIAFALIGACMSIFCMISVAASLWHQCNS